MGSSEGVVVDLLQILFATPSPLSALAKMLKRDQSLPSLATQVGKYPNSVPLMTRANGGRGDTVPLCIIPDLVESTKDCSQSSSSKG